LLNGTTELWWIERGLFFFLFLQAANAFAGSAAIGILADKLSQRISSWTVYPLVLLLSFAVLYSITAVVVGIYYVFPGHRINTDLVKYSLYFSTAAAPVLGIVAILAGRRPDHLT
jgi:MFS-type transporter involved in bile tolerance (Atg22 family)